MNGVSAEDLVALPELEAVPPDSLDLEPLRSR